LDAVGLVIAKCICPLPAAEATSPHETLPGFHPSRSATLRFTPRTTGLNMMLRYSRILLLAPARAMYLWLANHAASAGELPPPPACQHAGDDPGRDEQCRRAEPHQ